MPEYQEFPSSESSDVSSGDDEVVETICLQDPFDVEESKCIQNNKKVRRGLQYLKSGYIRKVQDCREERYYFAKAQVRASMDCKAYNVMVAISIMSGSVWKAVCDDACPQSALGRCSHVSALLLFLWSHIRLNGYGGMSFVISLILKNVKSYYNVLKCKIIYIFFYMSNVNFTGMPQTF